MARYVFSESAAFQGWKNADPDVIGHELELIASKNGGRLMPDAVWKTAAKRGSPLHPFFEWRVKRAAELHWLDQARTLIRSVRIVADDADEPRHAFLSIVDKGGTSYRTYDEVTGSRQLQLAVLQAAERDLLAWERRYRDLQDICELVRQAREKTKRKIDEHENRPPQ